MLSQLCERVASYGIEFGRFTQLWLMGMIFFNFLYNFNLLTADTRLNGDGNCSGIRCLFRLLFIYVGNEEKNELDLRF